MKGACRPPRAASKPNERPWPSKAYFYMIPSTSGGCELARSNLVDVCFIGSCTNGGSVICAPLRASGPGANGGQRNQGFLVVPGSRARWPAPLEKPRARSVFRYAPPV